METLGIVSADTSPKDVDATELAKTQFWERPYFTIDGKRHNAFININHALMPGAFNPPHEGHLCLADQYEQTYGSRVVFAMCANPPHKDEMTVQDCLKRAQLLRGRDRVFTRDDPYYIDKARRYPYTPMLIGADALLRMFDPKWGLDSATMLNEFESLGTKFYVGGRNIDGAFVSLSDVLDKLPSNLWDSIERLCVEIDGRWDISSTELRNKLSQDSK
jgi:nicotinic acid mononucleotide adenylyltransferase